MPSTNKALADFVVEAQEIVDLLSRELLKLGAPGGADDPDLVNGVFRGAHSLKGLAGMFGLASFGRLAHASEDLLDDLRLGRVAHSESLVDLLLEVVEAFQRMLGDLTRGQGDYGSEPLVSALVARIDAARGHATAKASGDPLDAVGLDPAVRGVLTEYEEHRLRENVRKGMRVWRVRASFDLSDFDKRLAELNGRLKPLGEVVSTLPGADAGPGGISFDLLLATSADERTLAGAVEGLPATPTPIGLPQAASAGVVRFAAAPPAAPAAESAGSERRRPGEAGEPADGSLRSVSQTVRVDIHKLDRLMNIVGELAMTKANLQRLAERTRAGTAGDLQQAGAELQRVTRQFERRLDELQTGILEVRMVPLEQVFDKLARMVRKIGREAGKELDLKVDGGDVELDKLIVEDLSDPLMHLIRNAIDHGVEAPEAREATGKPRRGTVFLRARQQGNHVVLEVGDDGAGIDEEAVRRTAVEKGLTTASAADELTRREILNLLFLPGFSTARQVSQLSGRGVGLDVVKTNIAKLSGIIDLQSVKGQGTTFAITLPVTLAIIRALIVGVNGRVYALPLNSVLEILQIDESAVSTIETREVVDVRGATLPLVRLSRLFRLSGARRPDRSYVVVVGLAQERLGFAVDELIGQQDVVVKPLGQLLASVRGIAGATDLGDRRTVLVLDVAGIVEEVLAGDPRDPQAREVAVR